MKRNMRIRLGVIAVCWLLSLVFLRGLSQCMVAQGEEPLGLSPGVVVTFLAANLIRLALVKNRNRDSETADEPARVQALSFSPQANRSQIVLFRNDWMGALLSAMILVDSTLFTELTSPGFTVVELAPGRHRLRVELEGQAAELDEQLAAGEIRVLHISMKSGLASTVPTLSAMAPEDARKLIGKAPQRLPPQGVR